MRKSMIVSLLVCLLTVMTLQPATAATAKEVEIEEGVYEILSGVKENMALDIADASKNSGANVQIYRYNGTTAQQFWIKKAGNDYTITPVCSGMALDVAGGTKKSGTNVQQYYHNNTDAQKWQFRSTGEGYYYIASGNYALDVSGGGTANGTNVQIYTPNFTGSQKWKLQKVALLSPVTTFRGNSDASVTCVVRIDNSLINKKGKQNATVKLQTYNGNKTTKGKVSVTMRDMTGKMIWQGVKNGGDTLKLGDDHSAYKITVKPYDSGSGWFHGGNDFVNLGASAEWGLTNCKNCSLYSVK